jgi:uncharacterized membrane protein
MEHSRHHIYAPRDLGAKAADVITAFVGSWAFVGIHAAWFILWILLRLEAFPFGLLTLLVSLEAIFLSTFVMMSQNRSAERDHLRDDHEAEEVDLLFKINQTQLEILQILRREVGGEDGTAPGTVNASATRARSQGGVAKPAVQPVEGKSTPSSRSAQRRRR